MAVAALPGPEPEDVTVIDVNTLTLGELEELEDITGRNVVAEFGRGAPSARTLTGVVWIYKKRSDPSFTIDQARCLDMGSFRIEAAANPKKPAG